MYLNKITKSNAFIYKVASVVVIMVALLLIVLLLLPERAAYADNSATKTYCITSVQIKEGETLWSIASEYYSEEFKSIPSYIAEIKRMNGLSSDTLYAGNYLLVPQFTE